MLQIGEADQMNAVCLVLAYPSSDDARPDNDALLMDLWHDSVSSNPSSSIRKGMVIKDAFGLE